MNENRKKFNKNFKEPLTKKFLKKEYIKKNKSFTQIMEEFNLSASKVIKRAKKLGIKKPAELKFKKGNPELKTKEALKKMYNDDKLSIVQIAEKLKMTTGSVTSLFKTRKIPTSKKLRFERRRGHAKTRRIRNKSRKELKNLFKETKRVKFRRKGDKCSEEKKKKLREKAIDRGTRSKDRSSAEIKMKKILDDNQINAIEQVGIKIYKEKEKNCYLGYVVDFFLFIKGTKHPIILEVDGKDHEIRKEIVKKDKVQNKILNQIGFNVIRISYKKISTNNLKKCLDELIGMHNPRLVKMKNNFSSTSYNKKSKEIISTKIITYNHKTKKDNISIWKR